jgi:hypothetical protein
MVHDEDLFELAQASYSQRKGRIGSNFPLSASGSKVVSVGAGEGLETSSQLFQDSIESPPLLSPLPPNTPAPISSGSSMPNTSTTSRKEDLGAAVAAVVNTSRSTARSTARRPSFMMHTKTSSATPVAGGQGSKTTGGGSKASQLSVTSNSKEVEVQVLTKLDIHDSPNLTLTGLENLSIGR